MKDYRLLTLAANILRFVGWLVIVIAIIAGVGGLLGLFSARPAGGALLAALMGVLQGVLILAGSEVIRLLLEIRSRTMQHGEQVRRLNARLDDLSQVLRGD